MGLTSAPVLMDTHLSEIEPVIYQMVSIVVVTFIYPASSACEPQEVKERKGNVLFYNTLNTFYI